MFLRRRDFGLILPDEEEVKLLIDAYENLIMVIRAVRDKKIDLDLEQGECIYRVYDKEPENGICLWMLSLIWKNSFLLCS